MKAKKPRNDLAAILLTGIPAGVVPGFQNYTGPVQADMLRLNVAVPPTPAGSQNPIGLVAGDAAGFPNGRRPIDDVTAIELKAVAGATIPLVDKTLHAPMRAAGAAQRRHLAGQHAVRGAVPDVLPVPVEPEQRVHHQAGHTRRRHGLNRSIRGERESMSTAEVRTGSPSENPHAGQGMVVLDIGGDIGALVVSAPASLAGAEIEICPAGARGETPDDGTGWWEGEWHAHSPEHGHSPDHGHSHGHGPAWPHVAVLSRPTSEGPAWAAVFPGLRAGQYEIWLRPAEPTALTVTVDGGAVSSVAWPS